MTETDKNNHLIKIWYGKKSKGEMFQGDNKDSKLAITLVLCAPLQSGS